VSTSNILLYASDDSRPLHHLILGLRYDRIWQLKLALGAFRMVQRLATAREMGAKRQPEDCI
jgi:hypothetical protein